jgi:uncharacterized repeat protein (TIGR01451 family)
MNKGQWLWSAAGALVGLGLWGGAPAEAQLLVGVQAFDADQPTAEGVYVYDIARGTRRELFVPADEPAFPDSDGVSGMAADDAGGVIYTSSADNLYGAFYNPADPFGPITVEFLGELHNPESGVSSHTVAGLAFANGTLYAVDAQFSSGFPTPEGIYTVDTATFATTLVVDLSAVSAVLDPGGFAFNPADNLFYITSDDSDGVAGHGRGLYSIDVFNTLGGGVGAIAFVTPYPAAPGTNNDVDGLAIGDNRAYFAHDGPGQFGIWDFASGAFTTPIDTPWVIGNEFSAGGWAPSLAPLPLDNDLVLTMVDEPDPLFALNTPFRYTVTVTNDSLVPTSDVVVTTTLDSTTTFSSTTGGGTHSAGVVTTNLGTMAPLATTSFDIVAISTIETTAFAESTVAAAEPDPALANNTASQETLITLDADLSLEMVATPNPIVGLGSANITYDITVTNAGPLAANDVEVTVALDSGTTFLSSTAGGLSGGFFVADFATIPSAGRVHFQIIAHPTGVGAFTAQADVDINAGPSADPDLSNNFVEFTSAVVASLPYEVAEVIYSTIPASPTSDVPGLAGRKFVAFERPYRSPDGARWILKAITDDESELGDEVIVTGAGTAGTVAVREGETPLPDLFDLVGPIDTYLSINDAGQFAFATNADGVDAADEVIAKWDGSSFQVVAREGNPAPATGANYSAELKYASIQDDGTVSFDADTDAPGAGDKFLLTDDGATILAAEGVTIPLNQPGGAAFPWDFWTGSDDPASNFDFFQVDATGEHWLAVGDTTNPDESIDEIGAFNNGVYTQESTILPGSSFASPVETGNEVYRHYLSRRGGHYAARAANEDGVDWVLVDGRVITWTGQPIFLGSDEAWFESIPRTHQVAIVNNDGDCVIAGFSDTLDGDNNFVAVLNDAAEFYREGQPIDLDGDGFDDNLFFWSFQDNDAFLTEDGWFYFVADLKDGGGATAVGQVFARIPVDLGETCPCEFDAQAGVDVFDLLAYLDLWFTSAPHADLDGVAGVDVFDLLTFLDCWFPASAGAPCPG